MNKLTLYKFGLGPLLLVQGRRLRATALRLPEAAGPRHGEIAQTEANAEARCRLLVVGDSSAAGVGVSTQGEALANQTATALAVRLGCPVGWQLVARSGVNTTEALAMVRHTALDAADVIVTALGVNDVTSQQSLDRFLRSYAALWEHLRSTTGATVGIISGLPPFREFPAVPWPLRAYLGSYAEHLERGLAAWCDTTPGLVFRPLDMASGVSEMAADGYHPGPRQYRIWGEAVAAQAAERLSRMRDR